jgi:hypothetical protein
MALSARREFFGKLALGAIGPATQAKAQTVRRRFIAGERQARSGYSPAVITEGGRIVWLAGMTGAGCVRKVDRRRFRRADARPLPRSRAPLRRRR